MSFLRKHWFDIGFIVAVVFAVLISFSKIDYNELLFLIWFNFIALLLHQFEEYRFPGYFPGMLNSVLFKSRHPDRYPLNTNSALVINVYLGWTVYILAALFYDKFILLAFITMLTSFGNFIAHIFILNIKAKTFYNPGQLTAVILFLPISYLFIYFCIQYNILTVSDYIVGTSLGIIINVFGLIKLIDLMKNEDTKYIFEDRQLMPGDRKSKK